MNIVSLIMIVSFAWICSEVALSRLKHSGSAASGLDRSSLRTLWTTIIFCIVAASLLSMSGIGTVPTGRYYPRIALFGLALIVAGLAIRWTAILTLRKYFTVDVSIASDHQLVVSGIYRFIRHPAYSGCILSFLGLSFLFSNWISMVVVFVPITAAFLYRISVEESVLLSFFGDKYNEYSARTKRLIPGVY